MYKALEEEKMTNDERRRMVGMRGNTNDKLNEYIKTREKGRKDNLKKNETPRSERKTKYV